MSWASGIRVDGEFSIANGDVNQLMAVYTRDFNMTGSVNTDGTFILQGDSLNNLFASPRAEATFTIEKGELNNVDIVRAVQSPAREGVRGGKTRFESLGGSLQVSDKQYSYRRLRLNSGPVNATGNVEIASDGGLAGRISAEVGSVHSGGAGNLTVAGNVKNPVLQALTRHQLRQSRHAILVTPYRTQARRTRATLPDSGAACNAAIRSSRGGWERNSPMMLPPPAIPNALTCSGNVDCS